MNRRIWLILLWGILCWPTWAAVVVNTVTQLRNAITAANTGGDKTILVADGTYTLSDMLYITTDGVTVRSQSGNRDAVILQGEGMAGGVSHIFLVRGSFVTIQDMTLGRVANHAIQIRGEVGASNAVMRNLHLVDTFEQMIKVSYDSSSPDRSSNGLVENCLFEYSAGIGPQWYIGGVDAHFARNWVVRNNIFKNIASPADDVAEYAVHFWSSGEDNLVEGNLIIDCDRGIGFGMSSRGHLRGIIRNNMIVHSTRNTLFADVAIDLQSAPGAQVYNNTVWFENDYPNAIEYRFVATSGVLIVNNLCNKIIRSRDGATGTVGHNVVNAQTGWFVNPGVGDLHLAWAVTAVIDQGTVAIPGLPVPFSDIDGQLRPMGAAIDIGAEEFFAASLQLLSPNGSEMWRRGEQKQITWTVQNVTDNLVIELLQGATVLGVIAENIDSSVGAFTWTVGRMENGSYFLGSNLRIRIRTPDGLTMAEQRL